MTKIEELKKGYSALAKKHSLPSFDKLDEQFEIRSIDLEKGNLINSIIRTIASQINNHLDNIYQAINPNQNSFYSMLLYNALNDKDREKISMFYQHTIELQFQAMLALSGTEQEKIEYINIIYNKYPAIKKELRQYLNLFIEAWEKIIKQDSKQKKAGLG